MSYPPNLAGRRVVLISILLLLMAGGERWAILAFSRQYATSCTTCHLDFPKLNDFGKTFKDAGFKFPKDEENFLKIAPVMLGAPAQKDVWPHRVLPGMIPGPPPIGLRMTNFFQFTSARRTRFAQLAAPPTVPGYIAATDFETGFFTSTPYFGTIASTRSGYTPGMQFLIHPNTKASFEYQYRPRQGVHVAGDAVTLPLHFYDSFRVNTFVTGLEFVY